MAYSRHLYVSCYLDFVDVCEFYYIKLILENVILTLGTLRRLQYLHNLVLSLVLDALEASSWLSTFDGTSILVPFNNSSQMENC